MLEVLIATAAALAAGFIDAIAGGGGVILFPTLLLLNLPVPQIVGTSKITSTCGTSIAAYAFWRSGKLTPELLKVALPFTAAGAFAGAWLLLEIPSDFLKPIASALIFALAVYLSFRPALGAKDEYRGPTRTIWATVLVSALLIGFYDGFFGPGTGMFLTYVMIRFVKLDFVRAAGNTRVLNLMSNVVPLAYFIAMGNIRYDLGIPMAIANMLGGYYGARSAIRAGPKLVRIVSICMALLLAGKLAYDYLQ